eukprot:TRINITY_DN5277_c0_g1_i1.p1 TRINITY_DN5277_c0_g1~~TRINITY_DN5277_c0_g1_i1.p1  ORF type:complete len:129 (+),score=32.71 TRINITY_DN5277_c0_g1_i1:133-519(+)
MPFGELRKKVKGDPVKKGRGFSNHYHSWFPDSEPQTPDNYVKDVVHADYNQTPLEEGEEPAKPTAHRTFQWKSDLEKHAKRTGKSKDWIVRNSQVQVRTWYFGGSQLAHHKRTKNPSRDMNNILKDDS